MTFYSFPKKNIGQTLERRCAIVLYLELFIFFIPNEDITHTTQYQ